MLLLSSRLVRSTSVFRVACLASDATAAVESKGFPVHDGPSSSIPSDERIIQPHINQIVEQIARLPLLEVADLNYALKKRLNIPDQPVFAAGAFAAAVPSANVAAAEEVQDNTPKKSAFAVKLIKFDTSKTIALIKEIRNVIPGLNLVQAKKFVESAPAEVKADLGKTEADELKAILEKVGATCEVV